MSSSELPRLVARLETAVNRLEAIASRPAVAPKPGHLLGGPGSPARSASPAPSVEPPPHVLEYDEAVGTALSHFLRLSEAVGGDVKELNSQLSEIFSWFRLFLWRAAGKPAPSDDALGVELAPLGQKITAVIEFRDSHRRSPLYNHLNAVSEGLPALSWVAIKPTPAPHVGEMKDSAQFYVNRVLKDNKEHSEWARAWIEVLTKMQTFVRKTHTTGLVWNSKPGAKPMENGVAHTNGASAPLPPPPPPPAGGPPPPPPPPPADLFAPAAPAGRDALFADLNKGEDVTHRLKKVTADMQTHKNPELRASSVAPGETSGSSASPSKTAKAVVHRPPRIQLENDQRWTIEYHKGNKKIVVEITDKKYTIYAYKCEDCVIQVKGKLNSITLDSCRKTQIVFDSLLAQCETVNCQSVTIQTLGEMPTLSIQKTDGCQVYLSEKSLNAEIVTSKSSEMNVLVPKDDGDFEEFPIPEQFKTTFDGKKLHTTVSDII